MVTTRRHRRWIVRRVSIVGGVLVCAIGFLSAAAARGAEGGAASLDARWVKAMKANDLEGVLACYAPDALLWLPDMPEARGAKAIRDAYSGFLGTMTVKDVSLVNTHYDDRGELSAGWGNFSMTVQPKSGGAAVVMKGRFIDVAKRVGGKWVYVADHASSEPAPAPPAAKP
jgi:ketosteroid isomerase-like protein